MTRLYTQNKISEHYGTIELVQSNRGEVLFHMVASYEDLCIKSVFVRSFSTYGLGFLSAPDVSSFLNRAYRILSGEISCEDSSVLEFV